LLVLEGSLKTTWRAWSVAAEEGQESEAESEQTEGGRFGHGFNVEALWAIQT
jgi:hypothetical protein